jgi:Protein of unknown function (DUF3168)
MTEVDLVTALSALVGGRVFPDIAPFETLTPFAVYQQVGGQAINYLEGQSPAKKNARIQVTIWSDTRLEAMTKIRQVEDMLSATPIFAYVEGAAIAHYDNSTKLRGALQDFSVWIG